MKRSIIRILFLTAVSVSSAYLANAQEGIDRHVEVVREYVPDVRAARKIDFEPNMVDTVKLMPEINYSIRPTPWVGKFEAKPINPIKISTAKYDPERPFYMRIGLGAPFQSLADVYATATTSRDLAMGVYLNHTGRWADIRNDIGDKEKAMATRNLAGAYLEKSFGRKLLSVNLREEYRSYNVFGAFVPNGDYSLTNSAANGTLSYNDLSLRLSFGDSFHSLEKFSYRIGASFSTFSGMDKDGQNDMGAYVDLGFRLLGKDFTVRTSFDAINGTGGASQYTDRRFVISPRYELNFDKFDILLGFDFTHNATWLASDSYFFPQVKFLYKALSGFMPYAEFHSGLNDGSYKALSYTNPYIMTNPYMARGGAYLPNARNYGVKAGIYGSLWEVVTYDLFGTYDKWRDYSYFVNYYGYDMEQSSYFLPMSCNNVNVLSIGAAVSADMGRGFSIDASVRLNGVMDGLSSGLIVFLNRPGARVDIDDKLGLGIPGFNLDLNLKYNYRERFFVSAGLGIVGQRKFSELALTPIVPSGGFSESLRMRRAELPASVDIGLELEYKVNSRLNIFLLGQNILNSKIYRFNHYPELGANILGGIKVTF